METRKLARKLALEMVGELKAPQWGLAEALDATALYEAMIQRFPEKPEDANDEPSFGDQRPTAWIYYLIGLLAAHRSDDAGTVALKLGDKASLSLPHAALERAGRTRDLADFFHRLLTRNPDLPFWSEYVQLAAKTGETGKMVALAEASAARPG